MNLPFLITATAITVYIDGAPKTISATHPNFEPLREAIRNDDEEAVRDLADVTGHVQRASDGRVQVVDGEVMFEGRPVHNSLTSRILTMLAEGFNVEPLMAFMDNLMDNPSRRAVMELYDFLEACDLPITPDGHFLAYKKVRENYTDIHSGRFDNSVGAINEMPRNEVDEDKYRTCSVGLHFCSYSYLPRFGGAPGNRVMVVKVNPADVVAIPADYQNSKGRTWRYEVVDELEDWHNNTLKPNFTDEYGSDEFEDWEEDGLLDDFDPDFDDEYDDWYDDVMDDGDDDWYIGRPGTHPAKPMDGPLPGRTVLTEGLVRTIKRHLAYGQSLTQISNDTGVSRRHIARIRDGEAWPHVRV